MKDLFKGKVCLVTGGTGSIGSEIVRQLLLYEPKTVRILTNDEDSLFRLEEELGPRKDVRYLIADVRDKERLAMACEGVDIVFHAAALKHVPICEYNPFEAIKTNVLGTQNMIDAALENNVDLFVAISTDKAVNPANTMGATKMLEEKLTISANYYRGDKKTRFSCVRFGNVLGSRGSVLPTFINQVKKGGPVTITDPNMTRFIMTISDSVQLIFKAVEKTEGGELFILKMPSVDIETFARAVIEYYAPKFSVDPETLEIKTIGVRPGEKLYEELITNEELERAYDMGDMVVVLPALNLPVPLEYKTSYTGLKRYETTISSKDSERLETEDVKEVIAKVEEWL